MNVATLHRIRGCEVCGSAELAFVLDLGMHPMCDDLVRVGESRTCREFPIEIMFCEQCRTAHQRFQIPRHELFPSTYHYRSRHTADVINGMRQLVRECASRTGPLSGKLVLDIGCNDGSLLSIFREEGARTCGIEPTGAADDAAAAGHTVLKEFLSEVLARDFVKLHGQPDIITFTNVFAHIENLNGVLESLRILQHERTVIVIENHYLGSVIDRGQFDTFYHEHPRTYGATSFRHIAAKLGRSVADIEFPARYGGNIRVFISASGAGDDERRMQDIEARERGFGDTLRSMSGQINVWRQNKLLELREAVERHGPLRGKAFPGRAAIPIKLLGADVETLSAVYEKPGSAKIGHYIPGTRIPILSDDDFSPGQGDAPLLNLAWHIGSEIRAYMKSRGHGGPIIDLIAPLDFAPRDGKTARKSVAEA
jgi:SAM-dependent methyltransferase